MSDFTTYFNDWYLQHIQWTCLQVDTPDFNDDKPPLVPIMAGGRLNKKDGLTRYGDSHVKDKTS